MASACAGARSLTYASEATHHSANETACSGWSASRTVVDPTVARSAHRAAAPIEAKTTRPGAEKRARRRSAYAMSATSKTTPIAHATPSGTSHAQVAQVEREAEVVAGVGELGEDGHGEEVAEIGRGDEGAGVAATGKCGAEGPAGEREGRDEATRSRPATAAGRWRRREDRRPGRRRRRRRGSRPSPRGGACHSGPGRVGALEGDDVGEHHHRRAEGGEASTAAKMAPNRGAARPRSRERGHARHAPRPATRSRSRASRARPRGGPPPADRARPSQG